MLDSRAPVSDRGELTILPSGFEPDTELVIDGRVYPLGPDQARQYVPLAPLIADLAIADLATATVRIPYTVHRHGISRDGTLAIIDDVRGFLALVLAGAATGPVDLRFDRPPVLPEHRSVVLIGWGFEAFGTAVHVRDLDLVAIARSTTRKVGRCGPYDYVQRVVVDHLVEDVAIEVFERRTGTRVASRTFRGKPRRCPDMLTARVDAPAEDVRDPLPRTKPAAWLRSLVRASAR
jgi:hypothetical protein